MDKVFADPQVKHIGMAAALKTTLFGDTHFVASPLNFQGVPKKLRCETPTPGQHTTDVLNWIGVPADEQSKLKAAGAI
jgi:formyl-CoA transferase